jgi:hypothetical protein
LADLAKVKPVDFRGREIKNTHPTVNREQAKEQDLSEGVEMTVSNNKF